MTDFSKIGRNNKNRGRAFEKKVAEMLGWTRVPYSGAIKSWGAGDVVDGFYKRTGYWSAECKTQQVGIGTLSIKQKYINQMDKGAIEGRRGLLIAKNVGELRSYAVMPSDSFSIIYENLLLSEMENVLDKGNLHTVGPENAFIIPKWCLESVKPLGIVAQFDVINKKSSDQRAWVVMTLDTFKYYIKKHDLMEYDDETKRNESRF